MKILFYALLATFAINLSSCILYKDIVNFQDGQDLEDGKWDSITNFAKWTIQSEDIIQINVFGSNQLEAEKFNIMDTRMAGQMMRSNASGSLMEPIGYRVDLNGDIFIPIVGRIHVKGKTVEDLKREVEIKVKDTGYLKDVNVQVRFLSFRITVLGEVSAPGAYILQTQKINVLEAIGQAGDLTIFANRDNILVIREKDGIREFGRINLKSKEIFESPYFYLQPGDLVYIEPHQAKVLSAPDPASRYINTIIGVISLVTLIFTLTK